MHMHLALPGLLWPAQALPDLVFDLDLPALSWLLGRARRGRAAPLAFEHWLAARFGFDAARPPAAALRLLGDGGNPGAAHWLCADPAHLAFEHGHPTLADPTQLELQADELEEIAVSLAPTFAGIGRFSLRPSGRGYIELAAAANLTTTPPSAAIGRGVATLLPQGPDARRFLHLANEAQIALHALELNQRREAAGKPTVNTLWFWGAGALTPVAASPYAKVMRSGIPGDGAGDTLAQGCARHAGAALHAAADNTPTAGATLLLETRLLAPAQQLDAEAWREALRTVERERLAPLLAALRSGKIRRLTVTGLGDADCVELELTRMDALRFWRRPRPLRDLAT